MVAHDQLLERLIDGQQVDRRTGLPRFAAAAVGTWSAFPAAHRGAAGTAGGM